MTPGDRVRVLAYPDTQFGPSAAHTRIRELIVGQTGVVIGTGLGLVEVDVNGTHAAVRLEDLAHVDERPACGFLIRSTFTQCQQPVVWNVAARDSDGQLSRAQSACDEHLSVALHEYYDGCIVDDDIAAQVRPWDPSLRELLD